MRLHLLVQLLQRLGLGSCWLLALVWIPQVHAQSPENLRTLFQTMDDLSPPGIWDKPLVRLELLSEDLAMRNGSPDWEFGILREQNEQSVSIWNSRIGFRKYPKRNDGSGDRYVNQVETESVQDQIRFFKEVGKDRRFYFYPQIEALFLARVAHESNESTLRDELIDMVMSLHKDEPLSYLTNEIIPREEYRRIVRNFEDLSISRETLHEELVRFVQVFPTFGKTAQATQLRDNIKLLVDEDAKHTLDIDLESLPVNERIAELIYQLRNQESGPLMSMQYHHARLQANANPATSEPCWKLYRLGFDAVPQLIEAISDSRPSRIVEFPRTLSDNIQILTIGQCAELILFQFSEDRTEFRSDSTSERQAAYRTWYAGVEKIGVKEHLIGIVEKGELSMEKQALLLARFYPEAALKSIPIGVDRTKITATRRGSYEVMSTFGELGAEYLVDQFAIETEPSLLMTLAKLLSHSHSEIAFEFILRRFEAYRDLKVTKNRAYYEDGTYTAHLQELAEFLVRSNRVEAIITLKNSMDSLPLSVRGAIVNGYNRDQEKEISQSVMDAIEALLIHELSDTGREHIRFSTGRFDWRVCDHAASALNKLHPNRYAFNMKLVTYKLDRQRMNAINEYRSRGGLPRVTIHENRPTVQADEQKVLRLVQQFLQNDESKRMVAETELMALGLSAYPAIEKQTKRGSLNDSEQKQLRNLLHRMSQIMQEVKISGDSPKLGEPVLRRLRELEGKQMTSEVLSDLVRELAGIDFGEIGILRIDFCNCEPNAGFAVDISATGYQGELRQSRIARMEFAISAGEEDETQYQGGPIEELSEMVARVLNDPMRTPVSVKILLHRQ